MAKKFWVELEIFGKELHIGGDTDEGFRFKMLMPQKGEHRSIEYFIIRGDTDESGNLIITIHQKGIHSNNHTTQEFEIKGE